MPRLEVFWPVPDEYVVGGKIIIDSLAPSSVFPGAPQREPAVDYLVLLLDKRRGSDVVLGRGVTSAQGEFGIVFDDETYGDPIGDYYLKVFNPKGRFVHESHVNSAYDLRESGHLVIKIALPRNRVFGWVEQESPGRMNEAWGFGDADFRRNPVFAVGERWVLGTTTCGVIGRFSGIGWEKVHETNLENGYYAVDGTDDEIYVVGSGGSFPCQYLVILKSVDGGVSWNRYTTPLRINFPPPTWAGQFGIWVDRNSNPPGTIYVVGPDDRHAYARPCSILLKSTDSGNTWSLSNIPTLARLRDVWGLNSRNFYAVGDHGTIMSSHDGGDNWSTSRTDQPETLHGVWGDRTCTYAVGGSATVLARFPRNENFNKRKWHPVKTPVNPESNTVFTRIWGSGPNDIFIVGASYSKSPDSHTLRPYGVILHWDGRKWTDESFHQFLPRKSQDTEMADFDFCSAFGLLVGIWGTTDKKHVFAVGDMVYHMDRSGPPGPL